MSQTLMHIGILGLLSVSAAGAVANQANTPSDLSCGVQIKVDQSLKTIQPVVQSAKQITGNYKLSIKGSGPAGTTNITQGGTFSAKQNEPTPISVMSVNANARLKIDFTVTAQGVTYDCSEEVAYRT